LSDEAVVKSKTRAEARTCELHIWKLKTSEASSLWNGHPLRG
jgi:hypothetical protein